MRTEELTPLDKVHDNRQKETGLHLLVGVEPAERGEHLLGSLSAGQAPRQWAHYPENDAIDYATGYQWFYHSHSPEVRPGAKEHGHIHLFARRPLWDRKLQTRLERAFSEMCGNSTTYPSTRYLLVISENVLQDKTLELLSEVQIDLDSKWIMSGFQSKPTVQGQRPDRPLRPKSDL